MYLGFVILTVLAGVVLPMQALINARLGLQIGGPVWAAAFSFLIGTVALFAYQLVLRAPFPPAAQAFSGPAWLWIGGVMGAFYVATVTLTVPRLGTAALIALIVLGQMVASLLLDHFGVLHDVHPLNPSRLLGAGLLIAGVWLIVSN